METSFVDLTHEELEQHMSANAVLLLNEMHATNDETLKQSLFEQAADQETSLISEVLEGAVVTDFTFHTKDGRLYLLQPNGVSDWLKMHEHGVLRAKAKAARDSKYEPYVEIAKAELDEAIFQESQVRQGTPSAMVRLSLSGEDIMPTSHLKKLGRQPEQKRAYLRVSVFDGQDLHIHSRSIDGLSLQDGRDFVTGWGLWSEPLTNLESDATSVDILKSQLYFTEEQMVVPEMHRLADELVAAFDGLQTNRTGQTYKAGRSPEGTDTYKFVLANQDLLRAHLTSLSSLAGREDLPIGHIAAATNDLRYDIMSSFKQRLEGTWLPGGSLGESVAQAGTTERTLGTQFGGCDIVIGSATTAERAGYTNAREASGAERAGITKKLRKEVIAKGSCSACGAKGSLYGCGLCGKCNKKWCDIFEQTGKQTPINKLAKYQPHPEKPIFGNTETLSEYWARLGREAEFKRLKKEAGLAESA